jgi:hypothetical protein
MLYVLLFEIIDLGTGQKPNYTRVKFPIDFIPTGHRFGHDSSLVHFSLIAILY